MLPQYFELHAVNNLGADIDASSNSGSEHLIVKIKGWKFDSNGALVFGSEITRSLAADVADGGTSIIGAVIDNSTDLHLGFVGRVELSSDDATHDGTAEVYLTGSTDNTTFPSDHANWNPEEDAILVCSLTFDHDGTGTDVKGTDLEYD